MEAIYNDYDHKGFERRLIQMKREIEKPLNSWDLSHYISALSSSYYKLELIYAIAIAIRDGIEPEDIFVMDGSFRLNFSYNNLRPSCLTGRGLNILYSIGKPISLYPNKDLFVVRLIFQLFHRINNFLSQKKCKRLTSDKLKKTYGMYINTDFIESCNYAIKKAKSSLEASELTKIDSILRTEQRIENYRSNLKQLENIKERVLSEYEKFESIAGKGIFSYISNCLKKNQEVVFEKKWTEQKLRKTQIMNQYFYKFYTKLSRLTRPVVGVYDRQNKKFNFLCSGHIKATQDFLDIKKVSHESPMTMILECGVQFFFMVLSNVISILFLIKKFKLESDRIKEKESDVKKIEMKIRREVELEVKYKELEQRCKKEIKEIEDKYQVKMAQLKLEAQIEYLEKHFYRRFYEKYFLQRKPVFVGQEELGEELLNIKLKNEADELLSEYEDKMMDLKDMMPIYIGENMLDIYENECDKAFRIINKYKF